MNNFYTLPINRQLLILTSAEDKIGLPAAAIEKDLWVPVFCKCFSALTYTRISHPAVQLVSLLLVLSRTILSANHSKADKSSQEPWTLIEATHFSDAADKIVWTKYGEKLKDKGGSFVPARVGK